MPNRTISADGEALPAEGRRSRRNAPVAAAAPAQAIPGSAVADPALAAVAAFDAANIAFKGVQRDDDDGNRLYGELERTLQALGDVVPTTRQGAILVLRRVIGEEMQGVDENSPLRAAIYNLLTFLEGKDAAPPADGRARS
jgi:hypothetical protein